MTRSWGHMSLEYLSLDYFGKVSSRASVDHTWNTRTPECVTARFILIPSPSWAGWGLMPYMSNFLATSSRWMSESAGAAPLNIKRRTGWASNPNSTVQQWVIRFRVPVFLVKLDDLVVDILLVGNVLLHLQVLTVQFVIVVPYFCCNTPRRTSDLQSSKERTKLCLNAYTAVCARPAGRRCCRDRSGCRLTSPALSVRQKDTYEHTR